MRNDLRTSCARRRGLCLCSVAESSRSKVNCRYAEEEKKRFRDDPERLKMYRKKIEHGSNKHFAMFEKDSQAQKEAVKAAKELMLERLGG